MHETSDMSIYVFLDSWLNGLSNIPFIFFAKFDNSLLLLSLFNVNIGFQSFCMIEKNCI